MLAPQIVMMYLPILKQQLISLFSLLPLWISQISIQMIDMLDLGETLITFGLEAKVMLFAL